MSASARAEAAALTRPPSGVRLCRWWQAWWEAPLAAPWRQTGLAGCVADRLEGSHNLLPASPRAAFYCCVCYNRDKASRELDRLGQLGECEQDSNTDSELESNTDSRTAQVCGGGESPTKGVPVPSGSSAGGAHVRLGAEWRRGVLVEKFPEASGTRAVSMSCCRLQHGVANGV